MRPATERPASGAHKTPGFAIRSVLSARDVSAVLGLTVQATQTALLQHQVPVTVLPAQRRGRPRHLYDRRDIDLFLRKKLIGDQQVQARHRLVRFACRELKRVRLSGNRYELRETGKRCPTASCLDEELYGLVFASDAVTEEAFDAWAASRGAPSAAEILHRLGLRTWMTLLRCARERGTRQGDG
jgi:hypothetical protein